MKKLLFGIGLALLGSLTQAQNGLQKIVVEKYYKANAADAAASVGTLPVGSVTYRIYADMLPGYKFQMAYGNANHTLILQTSTKFFNNEDRGATTPYGIGTANLKNNTVALDSWISVGAAATGQLGVLKSDDDGVNNYISANTVLKNNPGGSYGLPLTAQDGMVAGTTAPADISILPGLDLSALDATSQAGSLVTTNSSAWSCLAGAVGPNPDTNRVLIAQITTDGVFHYELNIQIGTPLGGTEKYVTSNPIGVEKTIPSLVGTLGLPNVMPTVSITAPAGGTNYLTGDVVSLAATAADADGTVTSVEFLIDGISIGSDATDPYTMNWTSTKGTHSLTAKATDNDGGITTSTAVVITVVDNVPPTVSITAPAAGATVNKGTLVSITANAGDVDGTVTKVEFYVNNAKVGEDATDPYQYDWTAIEGTMKLKAIATDNKGAKTTSTEITITVVDPLGGPYQVLSDSGSCATDLIYIPVSRIKDALNKCIGFDAVMSYDKTKVVPTGVIRVHNTLISDSLLTSYSVDIKDTTINIAVYLNSSAPAGTSFNGLGKIFSVEFSKTPGFKSVDTATFKVPFIMASYDTTTITRTDCKLGIYTTYKDHLFVGKLKFWSNNSPIVYDAANPSAHLATNIMGNLSSVKVQPDMSGVFKFDINHGDSISIDKDINDTTTVMSIINGYDAFLVQKVLVDESSFTPSVYQIIAMDVNMDGVVSAGDLSQINQRTVKTIGQFAQLWNASTIAPSKDWLFVDLALIQSDLSYKKSTTYPADDGKGYSKFKVPSVPLMNALPISDYLTCPVISSETYKAILLGDANGSYATVGSANMKKSANTVVFDLTKAQKSGNYIDIPVSFLSGTDVNALDFSTQFNNSNLSFVSVTDNTNSLNMLSNYNTADNTLRFTSSSLQNYDMTKSIVTVRFNSTTGKISSNDIYSTKAYLNGDLASIDVISITGINENKNETIIHVYPNPATTVLNVEVSENVTIQLFDLSGQNVLINSNVYANEKQELNIQNLAQGIYMMKISNDKISTVKKVIINK